MNMIFHFKIILVSTDFTITKFNNLNQPKPGYLLTHLKLPGLVKKDKLTTHDSLLVLLGSVLGYSFSLFMKF